MNRMYTENGSHAQQWRASECIRIVLLWQSTTTLTADLAASRFAFSRCTRCCSWRAARPTPAKPTRPATIWTCALCPKWPPSMPPLCDVVAAGHSHMSGAECVEPFGHTSRIYRSPTHDDERTMGIGDSDLKDDNRRTPKNNDSHPGKPLDERSFLGWSAKTTVAIQIFKIKHWLMQIKRDVTQLEVAKSFF